jgi:hypothetical protein
MAQNSAPHRTTKSDTAGSQEISSSPPQNFPWIKNIVAGITARIVKIARNDDKRTYNFYYLVVPTDLNPDLQVGDRVNILIQIGGPLGGFTAWVPGRVMGKFRNYQIYINRAGRSLAEYIHANGLVPIVLAIQKVDKTKG